MESAADQKFNILLVCSDDVESDAIQSVLAELNQPIEFASSGAEALRRLREQSFAAIVLDIDLTPGMDGFETAQQIRQIESLQREPIIFLSSRSDPKSIARASQLGALDYVVKPYPRELLRAKVAGLLALFQDRQRAVQQAEELYYLIHGTTDYAIFMLDPQGHIRSWNPGAQRMKGYQAHEIIGQHFSVFYPQPVVERGWPEYELKMAQETGRFEDEGWRVRKDGSQFWANVIITALRDPQGRLRGFSKVTRDLTDRKKAEDAERKLLTEETARKAAEESLAMAQRAELSERIQREQLHVTLRSIGDAVIVTDMNGVVTFINPIAELLTGWTAREAVNQPLDRVFRIINEQTREAVESPVTKVLREKIVVGLANHTLLISKDGQEIPIDDSGAPVRSKDGDLEGVVLVFRDATDSRRAADARARLAALVESSADAIIGESLDGRITSWNTAAEQLYEYKADEIIGQSILKIVPPDRQDELHQLISRAARGERITAFETVRLRKSGERVDVSITISPIRDDEGTIIGLSKIARDITASKDAAEALQASESRKAAILDTALDAIVTINHEGRIIEFNQAAERIFGYPRSQVIGREMAELIIPPSLRAQHYRGLARYLANRETSVLGRRLELSAMRANGNEFPVELAITPIHVGESPIFTAYVRDITDRRNHERRRNARLMITQTLAEATSLSQAGQPILKTVCETLEWDVGALWVLDEGAQELRCTELWSHNTQRIGDFATATRERTFARGIGLPGRIWESGRSAWIPDVTRDTNFPRAPRAAKVGLHGAFGCPIAIGPEFLGVIEFFSHEIREPDADLLEMMSTICGQIGQFLERKQAEGRLRESEQRFAGFMHHLPGLAWIKDLEGRYVYANDAAIKAFDRPAAKLYGMTDDDVFPPNTAAQFKINDRQALASDAGVQVIETLQHSDGVVHYSIVSKFPIYGTNGNPVLVGGMAIDITERIHAEQQTAYLSEVSVTLASLVDYESTLKKVANLSVPTFADWCTVDIAEQDGSLRRLAVAHIDPAKVQLARDLDQRYPPNRDAPRGPYHVLRTGQAELEEHISEAMLEEAVHDPEHLRILRELGLKSYMAVALKVRTKILGVLTFVTAESRRSYTPADLIIAEELARRAAIAIENARLYADLREADRLKDEFLAMLAHELRNPLAPIRNALEVMKMPGASSVVINQVRDMAERQVQHMARLLDDLLDVSRISRGKVELRKRAVDVVQIVNRTIEAVHSLIESRQHRLVISLPPSSIWVEGDPTRLEQVLTNLLNNAAKYTDPGGQISVSVDREDDDVVLRVRDTGVGIPLDVLPRIFDLFVQVERRLDRSQGGVGIGLTLVKRLVELHGGSVEARSEGSGRGSEFIVRLPMMRGSSAGQKPRPQDAFSAPQVRPRRVLVVDDNHDAADTLAMLLRVSGHDVLATYSGREALEIARQQQPEVIFLDIGMPGMDGYEVAYQLRRTPGLESTVLVALTGWGQAEDRRRTKEAGFDVHIVKPIEPSVLQKLFTTDIR